MKRRLFKIKAAKYDYTPQMLPQNRKQVFFDVVKLHYAQLLSLGFILILFSLPLLISQILQDNMTSSIISKLTDASTEEEISTAYKNITAAENLRAVINVALFMLYSVGFSGVIRVVRQYAWEQNVRLMTDFSKGVKQNIGQMLFTAFIGGLIYALCVYAVNLASLSSGAISWLLYMPVAISVMIVFPVICYTVIAISVYSNKWWKNLKIGFAVFAKSPFKTLLAVLCCIIIYIPQCIPNFYCHVIGRIVSSLLTPFALLGWLLFSFNQLDKFVNITLFPSVVGKGTFAVTQKAEECSTENQDKSDNL